MFFDSLGRSRARRRGVVLILILGMLALMALIGVTFATFAGQSLINTRNFAAGVNAPSSDQLMDYALAQLINDTNNPLSAIRGHSLLRDMYGNDSVMGRRFDQFQASGTPLAQGSSAAVGSLISYLPGGTALQMSYLGTQAAAAWKPFDFSGPSYYISKAVDSYLTFTTNIPTAATNPAFYGLDFTRWLVRVPGTGGGIGVQGAGTVNATYEILEDDYSGTTHIFTLAPADPIDSTGSVATHIWNNAQPNPGATATATVPSGNTIGLAPGAAPQNWTNVPIVLDGRYMRAFNGPGMSAFNFVGFDPTMAPYAYAGYGGAGHPHNNAAYANFLYNGALLPLAFAPFGMDGMNPPSAANPPSIPAAAYSPGQSLGDPNTFGMDEDYDACDLENWFLALQSADGSVMIPSFHRPGILTAADWTNTISSTNTAAQNAAALMSKAKILRPRAADNYAPAFPPDPSTPDKNGRLTYDVDNDGDGVTDSVWLDLGYPVLRDARGQSYKPLFAFMVLGLNGRLPLNTAGNLQSRDFQRITSSATTAPPAPNPNNLPTPTPFQYDYYPQNFLDGPTWSHASHLGYSVNEVNPLFALQNAPNLVYGGGTYGTSSTFTQFDVLTTGTVGDVDANGNGLGNPQNARVLGTSPYLYGGNYDYTTGTSNITTLTAPINPGIGVDVVQLRNLLAGTIPADSLTNPTKTQDLNHFLVGGVSWYVPDGMYEPAEDTKSTGFVYRQGITAVPGRWGEANAIPPILDNNGGGGMALNVNGMPVVKSTSSLLPAPAVAINSTYPVYDNPVRAGKSAFSTSTFGYPIGIGDAGDDDYDALDFPFPPFHGTTPTVAPPAPLVYSEGEGIATYNNGALDYNTGDVYDNAASLVMPVERIRRFFNPIDAMGVGRVVSWEDFPPRNAYDYGNGYDYFGRVMFFRHFRPAGLPKTVGYPAMPTAAMYQAAFPNASGSTMASMSTQLSNDQGLNQPVLTGPVPNSSTTTPSWDTTNNILHGYMSALAPIIGISTGSNNDNSGDALVAVASAMPYDLLYNAAAQTYGTPAGYAYSNANPSPNNWTPPTYPNITTTNPTAPNNNSPATMSTNVNTGQGPVLVSPDPNGHNPPAGVATVVNAYPTYPAYRMNNNVMTAMPAASLNKDEADEMVPPIYGVTSFDMPYGPGDLEWLYRLHDVDGAQLSSRLGSLAPVSFLNPQDGLTRRRMFSVDVAETINAAFAPDNQPPQAFDFVNSVAAEQANTYNSRSATAYINASGVLVGAPSASLSAITYNSGYNPLGAQYPTFQNPNSLTLYPNPVTNPPPGNLITLDTTTGQYVPQQNPNSNAYQYPPVSQPSLGSRDRKINLNYPLPVSNDPAEPVRQKWIRETYQYFKAVLPPQAVDTPDELAQLSQFVVNIIDFRDPDCSATRFVNTDVMVLPATSTAHAKLVFADRTVPVSANGQFIHYPYDPTIYDEQMRAYQPRYGNPLAPGKDANNNPFVIGLQTDWSAGMQYPQTNPTTTAEFLVQHGMEYSPLALNEVLAYQYQPSAGGNPIARLAVELVNTLTDDATAAPPGAAAGSTTDNSESDLTTAMLDGWDFIVMNDGDGYGRPDPHTGELPLPGLLNAGSIYPSVNNAPSTAAYPSSSTATNANLMSPPTTFQAIISASQLGQTAQATTWPTNVFALQALVNGAPQERVINGLRDRSAIQNNNNNAGAKGGGTFFQLGWTSSAIAAGETPAFPAGDATFPSVFGLPVPSADTVPGTFTPGQTLWLWLYLRRPANPFDTRPYPYREMVTVDSIRFPFTYASATGPPYSVQRLQPYRGGQLVPLLSGGNAANNPNPGTCWGYSEQTANGTYPATVPGPGQTQANENGGDNSTGMVVTISGGSVTIPHTFAVPGNTSTQNGTNTLWDAAWDYFVFNDRDFMSVAELTLVPGCPPGLFTKQFVENNDPWDQNVIANGTYSTVGNNTSRNGKPYNGALQPSTGVASNSPVTSPTSPTYDARPFPINESETYPYLVDKFFYSAASVAEPATNPNNQPYPSLVGGWTGDGWYKLLEFVEVPSSANGAIGQVASGDNFDWLRQDLKPGLLNLNLIIDEEVFFGLMDELRLNDTLNTSAAASLNQIPYVVTQIDHFGYPVMSATGPQFQSANMGNNGFHRISDVVTLNPALGTVHRQGRGYTYFDASGAETHGMKAAFADFLKLRAGGSGFLFAWGSGATGSGPVQQYNTVTGPYGAAFNNLPAWMASLTNPQPGLQVINPQTGWVSVGTPVARERPFRSLSARDINDTILRPAALPPSQLTFPGSNEAMTAIQAANPAIAVYNFFPPYQFNDFFGNPSAGGATATPNNPATPSAMNQQTLFVMDPGIRNPFFTQSLLYDPAQNGGNIPNAIQNYAKLPPLIPPRRLFAIPDNSNGTNQPTVDARHISGAAEYPFAPTNNTAGGPGYDYLPNQPIYHEQLATSTANLISSTRSIAIPGAPLSSTMPPTLTVNTVNHYLGAGLSGTTNTDNRQHPYFRTELLQKVMNLTTVRTHQFAVWITVGFFEVLQQGSAALGVPDLLGGEVGLLQGESRRFRSFFLLDRTKATGFDPYEPGDFRDVVTYRRRIE